MVLVVEKDRMDAQDHLESSVTLVVQEELVHVVQKENPVQLEDVEI